MVNDIKISQKMKNKDTMECKKMKLFYKHLKWYLSYQFFKKSIRINIGSFKQTQRDFRKV